jgi:2-keto-3-deoxy-L-rhamnonate aldolase RhmA
MHSFTMPGLPRSRDGVRRGGRKTGEARCKWCSARGLRAGALVVVVPTVDTVEEAIAARDWTYFPPLGKRSLGGGFAFGNDVWGGVPGGYRNIINDNVVLILMIETLEGLKNAGEIAKVPGVHAIFAASSDLGNFARYKLAKRPELRARSVRSENRHTR